MSCKKTIHDKVRPSVFCYRHMQINAPMYLLDTCRQINAPVYFVEHRQINFNLTVDYHMPNRKEGKWPRDFNALGTCLLWIPELA